MGFAVLQPSVTAALSCPPVLARTLVTGLARMHQPPWVEPGVGGEPAGEPGTLASRVWALSLVSTNPPVQTCTSARVVRLRFTRLTIAPFVPGRSGRMVRRAAGGRAGRGGAREAGLGTWGGRVTSHGPGSACPPHPTAGGRGWKHVQSAGRRAAGPPPVSLCTVQKQFLPLVTRGHRRHLPHCRPRQPHTPPAAAARPGLSPGGSCRTASLLGGARQRASRGPDPRGAGAYGPCSRLVLTLPDAGTAGVRSCWGWRAASCRPEARRGQRSRSG